MSNQDDLDLDLDFSDYFGIELEFQPDDRFSAKYPHICPHCGSPAQKMFNLVICSRRCRWETTPPKRD